MQEKLLNYYRKHKMLFLSNFRKALDGFDPDAIHDMRVAVKRLRAVYILLESNNLIDNNKAGEINPLKELFRLSGRMRDTQVQIGITETYAGILNISFKEYIRYLKTAEEKSIHKFTKYLVETGAGDDLRKRLSTTEAIISDLKSEVSQQQVLVFVEERITEVKAQLSDQVKDENLHEVRRKLKQCHYLLSILDPKNDELPSIRSTIRKLNRINEMLGDWHDLFIAREMLEKFQKKEQPDDLKTINRYLLLHEKLSEERQKKFVSILDYYDRKLRNRIP